MASEELVVVGAGPAGLTAAWRAAVAGHRVTVLERDRHVGGMAASTTVAGQRVDLGSHRLHPAAAPHVLAAIRTLLGGDLQVRTRNGRIRVGGEWVGFPLRPDDLLRSLPRPLAGRMVRDLVLAPARRPRADTFAEVVRAGLGPTVLEHVYAPFARKLWDAAPEDLDGEVARRRVSADGPVALARRVVGRSGAGRTFLYPRLGYGQIVDALADAAVAAGATIRVGAPVTGLEIAGGSVTVAVTADGGAGGARIDAGHVLWTGPLSTLVRAVRPAPPRTVGDAVTRLRHRAAVLVYLVVDRQQYTPFDAHYLPDPDLPVVRLSEPRNYRDGPDPEDRTVLCAELPCWVGDRVWRSEPDDLGALVTDALLRAGLPDPAPVAVEVRRLPHVYPVFRTGLRRPLEQVDRWVDALPRLTVLGRQPTFVQDNLHHVVAMGWDAAGSLRPGPDLDQDAWQAARARHARHVVED